MKKIIALITALSLLLILTACGQTKKMLSPEKSQSTSQKSVQQEFPDGTTARSEKQIDEKPKETSNTDITYSDGADATDTNRQSDNEKLKSGIVAKSDNVVGNNDKAALLTQLDKELDELLASINELEDLEDSDLE